ncbi:hypothetical protein [Nocardia anaemiae]|nr:hypothetical protein [Nocardia anaemiae]
MPAVVVAAEPTVVVMMERQALRMTAEWATVQFNFWSVRKHWAGKLSS